MAYWWIVLSMMIGVLGALYNFYRNYTFFQRRGVIHIPSVIPILGSMASVIFRRTSFADFIEKIYNFCPDAKYFGLYAMRKPIILIRDLELAKAVFITSFEKFSDRPSFVGSNEFLIANNLFCLRRKEWKHIRNSISPCFSFNKMKIMFALMSECAMTYSKFLSTLPADKNDVDMKDVIMKYTSDIITMCVYGIKVNSLKNPTNEFYVCGQDAAALSETRAAKYVFSRTFPRLFGILNMKLINNRASNFFRNIVKKIMLNAYDVEHVTRSSMIKLMMDIGENKETTGKRKLNMDEITAQTFLFFFGGYETTSSTLYFAAYEIVANPKIQIRLRQEIDEALKESDSGEVTYEIIHRLKYLDAFMNEVLRFYPPAFLERTCDRTCELPPALPGEKPFVMEKGMICWIPVYAIHHDEKYYDDPDRFDPDRFLNNKVHHNSLHYMPFGSGPRKCIGDRFAMLNMKLLLFHLLAQCELKPCAKSIFPLRICKKNMSMNLEGGFRFNVQRRTDI